MTCLYSSNAVLANVVLKSLVDKSFFGSIVSILGVCGYSVPGVCLTSGGYLY